MNSLIRRSLRRSAVPATALLAAAVFAPSANALPGPRLEEPQAKLDEAVKCTPDVDSATRTPVLLVPGTGASPQNNYAWNYLKILPREGYPVCTLTYRERGLIDLQIQVEYVVNAIRLVEQRSGRKIAIIGHSQGAILNSYALRFWPDLARKVDDFIGVAGTYTYGTDFVRAACVAGCPLTLAHQIMPGSPFMAALARTPLPPGPGYTAYLTLTDPVIRPQPEAGTLEASGARTYTLQDLCPGDLYEHDLLVATAATVALTLDALSHPGPAAVERLTDVPCGLVPEALGIAKEPADLVLGNLAAAGDATSEDPRLRCYMDPACPKSQLQPTLRSRTTPKRDRRPPFAFTTSGSLELPEGATRQCEGSVTVQIKRGRRTISRSAVPLSSGASPNGADCEFTSTTTVQRRADGPLRVITRFTGSDELYSAGGPSQRVRAGRPARAGGR